MPRKDKDRIRPGDSWDVFGHTFRLDEKGQTQRVQAPRVRYPGPDYGADPIGDGTFRMVPSGDIVTLEERTRRLTPL